MKQRLLLGATCLMLTTATARAEESAPAPTASVPASNHGDGVPGEGDVPKHAAGQEILRSKEPIVGTALEVLNNGGYSYVLVQRDNGAMGWVAVTQVEITVGSRVAFAPGLVMKNFESKGLKRKFDAVIFSGGPVALPAAAQQKLPAASPGSKGAAVGEEKISVTKATGPNAVTVAEAYANRAKLDGKKVTVRGKVVKVSGHIMKRNWIHLQDGTGSKKKANYNLVCTSKETAPVGEVVTVSGTLAKDRDFGSGYKYQVLIENATVKR